MAIRWDKLTLKSQEAIQKASSLAAEHGNPELLPMHLLATLLEDQEGIIVPVLQKVGVPTDEILAKAKQFIPGMPKDSGASAQPSISSSMQKVIDQAFKEAENFKD